MVFKVKLAEQVIKIECLYERVREMCAAYLIPEEVAESMSVKVLPEDIERERERAEEPDSYSPDYLETLAVYRKIAEAMPERDIFLMHGTVFAIENHAFMLTAPSGTGKTTMLRQILKLCREAFVVNGDKPLIGLKKDGLKENGINGDGMAVVYGTPWSGKEHLNTNCGVPLTAICFLKRGEENSIQEISFSEALAGLMAQTYRPANTAEYLKTLSLIGELKDRVRFYRVCMKRYERKADIENEAAMLVLEETGKWVRKSEIS